MRRKLRIIFLKFAVAKPNAYMTPFTLNIRGRLLEFTRPVVMGIVNVTPDSFFDGSRSLDVADIERRVEEMCPFVDIFDLGGYSSRRGADDVSSEVEIERLERGLEVVRRVAPGKLTSVDTFRAHVAEHCVARLGADIVNDISGGTLDPLMVSTVARLRVPYVLMHMRGTPATMQGLTDYADVTAEVVEDLARKLDDLRQAGVADVIVDPGFGFAKTTEQNFRLLAELEAFSVLDAPVLVGVSRKSMIYRTLGATPEESLNGTTVLNTVALMKGASILRVHDPREASQAVALTQLLKL